MHQNQSKRDNNKQLTAMRVAEMQALCNQTESSVQLTYMFKFRSYEAIVRSNSIYGSRVFTGDFIEVLDQCIKHLGDILTLPF